jgi:hypothetical protein
MTRDQGGDQGAPGPGQGRFRRAERAIVLPGLTPASARAVLMSWGASREQAAFLVEAARIHYGLACGYEMSRAGDLGHELREHLEGTCPGIGRKVTGVSIWPWADGASYTIEVSAWPEGPAASGEGGGSGER